ncbi:putative T7SS-secreted protein [Streptomyces xantholiticus]|uniref:putative T7SS-secreted protein n=1 Tax=Streptomyces xantholiticus TaxID=68285 RepID=UPI00227D7613|nr:hypothetical protein [Streptomyces xantholiticus]
METYSRAITGVQGKAKEAIALYEEGEGDSRKAVEAYNKKVSQGDLDVHVAFEYLDC